MTDDMTKCIFGVTLSYQKYKYSVFSVSHNTITVKRKMNSSVMLVLLIFCWDKCRSNDFNSRSASDWRRLWHTERHRRCYRELVPHMETVCSNDIYKVARRSQQPSLIKGSIDELIKRGGQQLRRVRRGIMDECCSDHGCSWEEYAEYCPTNRRIRTKK